MLSYKIRKRLTAIFSVLLLLIGLLHLRDINVKTSLSDSLSFDRTMSQRFMDHSITNASKEFTKRSESIKTRLPREPCSEVTHVVFLKIHKTGSATISSILIHFGITRNLTFALPELGTHFPMKPILKKHILPIAAGKHYDLLVTHSTYNPDTIKQVFPNDTRIIGPVREPLDHFISAFYFYEQYKTLLPDSLRASNDTTKQIEWLINNGNEKLGTTPNSGSPLFNRVSYRFGIPYSQSLNVSYVRTYIDSVLDKELDFVLVQEYFDESLVLLKRRFCWQLSDIIYLSYHVNPRARTDHVYIEQLTKRHKELAVAEYMIYDHFHKKFWETVWAEGPGIFDEVRVFKAILRRIQSFCSNQPSDGAVLVLPSSRWNIPFSILGKRCRDMQVEIRYIIYFQKKRQNGELLKHQSNSQTR